MLTSRRLTWCSRCANDDLAQFRSKTCTRCGGSLLDKQRGIAGLESPLEATFRVALEISGIKIGRFNSRCFAQEYTLQTAVSTYRLDFAWVEAKVGLEIQGGTWSGGAHSRAKGQARDARKNNALLGLGWRVATATNVSMEDPLGVLEQIYAILECVDRERTL